MPAGSQGHRDLGVDADREHDVHELLGVPVEAELVPRRVGNDLVVVQLVGGLQQRAVGAGPARRVRSRGHAPDLVVGQLGLPRDADVLAPFVVRAAPETGSQDEQLPLAGGQRRLEEGVVGQNAPALQQLGVVGERGEDVQRPAHEGLVGLEQRPYLRVPLVGRHGRDAGGPGHRGLPLTPR
jgi:hypothetical protein